MHHKGLVNGSRLLLTMLLIAAVVLLGLAAAIGLAGDPPEAGGWLRVIFGEVFTVIAVGLAAVLGIPSAIGLWAMSGANVDGAVPALDPRWRRLVAGFAVATAAVTAVVLLVTGSAATVLNLGLLAIVALASFGLAGAASFSTHRVRAVVCAGALVLVAAGAAWVLLNAFV